MKTRSKYGFLTVSTRAQRDDTLKGVFARSKRKSDKEVTLAPVGREPNPRIHPDGYIIGGAHEKGMRHAALARAAGLAYFENQVAIGNIVVISNRGRIRYKIKRQPKIPFGSPDELARLRAQQFLRAYANEWITRHRFDREFAAVYDNLVNAFKS
jgi:hypothetical protein